MSQAGSNELELGGGVRKPDTWVLVQSLNLATFFSLIFLKEEECSLNMSRKGEDYSSFLGFYCPVVLAILHPVFCEAIRIPENRVGSNLRDDKLAQA